MLLFPPPPNYPVVDCFLPNKDNCLAPNIHSPRSMRSSIYTTQSSSLTHSSSIELTCSTLNSNCSNTSRRTFSTKTNSDAPNSSDNESSSSVHQIKRNLAYSRSFSSKLQKPTPPVPPKRSASTRRSFGCDLLDSTCNQRLSDSNSTRASSSDNDSVLYQSSRSSSQNYNRPRRNRTHGCECMESNNHICRYNNESYPVNQLQNPQLPLLSVPTGSLVTTPVLYIPGMTSEKERSLQPVQVLAFQQLPICNNQPTPIFNTSPNCEFLSFAKKTDTPLNKRTQNDMIFTNIDN